jgi:hypothetical protein
MPDAAVEAPRQFAGAGIVVKVSTRDMGHGNRAAFITVQGDLKSGDERAFKQAVLTVDGPVVVVSLQSRGGDLRAGMEIGRTIRSNQFETVVEEGVCASACALAWLAGRPRYAGLDASIGFHAPTRTDDPARAADSVGSAFVGAYLQELGLTAAAIEYMTEAGPDEMNWLTSDEARGLGIYVEQWAW